MSRGQIAHLLDGADLDFRRDRASGRWIARAGERQRNQKAELVEFRHLAGPGLTRDDFQYLTDREFDPALRMQVDREDLQRFGNIVRKTRSPVDAFNLLRLHVVGASPDVLDEVVRFHFEQLGDMEIEGSGGERAFENRGVHLVRRSNAVVWRSKFPSILQRIQHDPRLRAGDLVHVFSRPDEGTFQSSEGLADGVYLMDAYLGPLLAAASPAVWAVNAPREIGNILFSLGQTVAGTRGEAAELLQLIYVPGSERAIQNPPLSPMASTSATKWWASALNDMFAVVSDFAVYAGADCVYRADKHLQAILTVEQLFRRVTSGLVAERDSNARRVLMFTALDTLERLTGIRLEKYAHVSHAQATLAELEGLIWPAAAELLLPTARRAVEALAELQEGFFLSRQIGTAGISFDNGGGASITMGIEQATAFYVKALRDATHGHGSNRQRAATRTDALLAHHNGRVPHDLGLLPYLYLLDMLAHPHRLRAVVAGR